MLTGELEPTNEWYAIAKIAGQKLCDAYRRQYGSDFISIVPATIYGPGDNFDLESGHVLPSLLRRFHEAKVDRVGFGDALWGSGSPVREFLYVDDFADAVAFITASYAQEGPINVGAPTTDQHPRACDGDRLHRRIRGTGRLRHDEARWHGRANSSMRAA